MVKPRIAWLYRPGVEEIPREGTLSMEDGGVRFDADNGRTFTVARDRIRKVKRLRASPVLQVIYRDADGRKRVVFYYFTSPPELGNWRGHPWTRADKKGRRQSFGWLEERGKELKTEVAEWAAELGGRARKG